MRSFLACLLLTSVLLVSASFARAASPRTITIEEALQSTRQNNITWRSLGEFVVQADAGRDIGIGMFLPKFRATGTWLHMGERHTPDLSGLMDMGLVLGDLVLGMIEEHPNQAERFAPYMDMFTGGGEGADTFSNFVPLSDTVSGAFSVAVPIFNPETIPLVKAAHDRYDAAVQRVGYGRESLLYAVTKAYFGLCTLQNMIAVTDNSLESAREHHRSSEVRASLQTATKLEVKRAELEVTKTEAQKIELLSNLEKAKAGFRYLTGLGGDFTATEPALPKMDSGYDLQHWQDLASRQRKDLAAARIETLVADHEVDQILMKYVPSLNLFGEFKADNAEAQRFDDDPFSWTVGATLSVNIWDGGIRESELEIARSRLRQAQMAEEDLASKIASDVDAAYQALKDAAAARALTERQLEVARDTQELARAAESAGAATNLEVIDANTMVFFSEAQYQTAVLDEAIAILDLMSTCGTDIPFGDVRGDRQDQGRSGQ